MSEEIENPEIIEENNNPIVIGAGGAGEPLDEVEQAFNDFNKTNSEFKPEENQQPDPSDPTEIDLSQAENFKLQIFISLMFTLLDGLHVFIYGFMSKYKITREDIGLDETDKQGLEIYFKTQRVMDLINRLPVEVIGFLHIEYMYFNKFQEFNKRMKEEHPEEPEEEEEEIEEEEHEEEEEETPDQKIERIFEQKKAQFESKKKDIDNSASVGTNNKNVSKKAAPKKAAPKKAATKKAAPKKAEVKKAAPKKAAAKKTIEEK
jgi:pyruvate/2-oxoglutarate dehydrogenase complex dihydrolipoamide acyltransferase (E2) component